MNTIISKNFLVYTRITVLLMNLTSIKSHTYCFNDSYLNPISLDLLIFLFFFRGKIRFYTLPPEDSTESFVSAEIVTEHVKEFDISEFQNVENNILDVLDDATNKRFVTYLPFGNEKVQDNNAKKSEVSQIFQIST